METPKEIVKIEIAEQDLAEVFQKEIDEILEFLGRDPAECLITDESSILDFATCYPEGEEPEEDSALTYQDCVDQWKAWLETAWSKRFPGVLLGVGKDRYLVNLAARIRESRNVQ
ncbi:MAG: hypothetical protein ACYCSH_07410 [Acidithiobacillus sp.]